MEVRDWPPTENRMPSLARLDSKNVLNVVLNSLVGDRGVQGIPGRPLMVHLARLMDKTILSYEEARRELDRYVTAPRDRFPLSPLLRAQDHLETCIDALRRADAFAEALRRLEEAPHMPRPSPPHRTAMATVKQFRDRLQHTDEGIQRCVADGRTNAIDDYWLKVKADRVSLGELSLLYGVLARAIEGHHDITRDIVAAMPPE
jgi:hypothetical protein